MTTGELTVWRHKKTCKLYVLLAEIQIERPDTHEWVDGILYANLDTKQRYARSKSRFYESFTQQPIEANNE